MAAASLSAFRGELEQLARKAGPTLARTYQVIRLLAVADVKGHFAAGRAPDGSPWQPLAHSRPSGPGKPLRDTGQLAASVTAVADASGVTISSNKVQARLHNEGGVVTPKRGKFLAIPLTREAARVRPRQFPRALFFVTRGGGKGALVERGTDGRLTSHYALVTSVRVPARPFLGLSAKTLDRIETLMLDELTRPKGVSGATG